MEILIKDSKENPNGIRLELIDENSNYLNSFVEVQVLTLNDNKLDKFFNYIVGDEINSIRIFDCEDIEGYSDNDILREYKDNFKEIFEIKAECKDTLLFIDLIENNSYVKGLGFKLLNYLKERYHYILLYSTEEASTYWRKNGFTNCFLDYYFWKNV